MLKTRFVSFALLAAVVTTAYSQETVTLRYKPTVGKVYRYSTQLDMAMTGPMSMNMRMLMVTGVRIGEITDGTIKTIQTVDYFRMREDPNTPIPIDSAEQIKKMRTLADVDHLGKVVSQKVEGAGGSISSVNPMLSGIGSSSLGIEFSKDPVAVGGSWDQVVDLTKAMGAAAGVALKAEKPLTMHFTLKSLGEMAGRKVAFVEWTVDGLLKLGLGGAADGENAGGGSSLTFTGSGKAVVDLATGFNLKTESAINIAIAVTGIPQAAGAGEMNQKIGVKSTLLEPGKLGD
jgi:hypothetical protein